VNFFVVVAIHNKSFTFYKNTYIEFYSKESKKEHRDNQQPPNNDGKKEKAKSSSARKPVFINIQKLASKDTFVI
jgi:hypothetical protein